MFDNKKNKRIIFFVQQYKPKREAVSNEIEQLANHLESKGWTVKIHDLHLQNIFKIRLNQRLISYHFIFYPFTFIFVYIYSLFFDIRHIYTSLGDLPYLLIINKKPLSLTASAPCSLKKIKKRIKRLNKLSMLVLESEIQKKQLNLLQKNPSLNINFRNIILISPGVDLNKFYYQKSPRSKFSILFASNPKNPKRYESRGIYLLLETAKNCKDILFDFAWRPNNSGLNIKELIQQKEVNNAVFTNQYITDMNPRYGLAHCTIIPFLRNKDVKLMPNSAIESLAAGKPVLCSSKSGIAEIITRYKVGIVFEPTLFSLVKAIEKLKNNYQYYQKNCRKTAELLFSESKFKSEYSDLFDKLLYSASNEKNLKTIFL